ncbi:MAG: Aspartyl/glutamyl-tRNA amidotransferase subunit C [Candidatus Wolfebacteria bacterium GW2011_GWC1_37_10]|uniref:Aspartyl/glutamyl-tRNA(Asn/Gln) amidotransferase subunit C n=2 Tax=Candidatus Wolfeibacteriota TaxID=1752735 RepID=A0A0G0GAV6_9BACT|nr:MAG: Aspartyl/glutamyl-tRNA amidotransferase subunit C [Candidatus Wolfebacteria bacterium GW2011_GWC1_37_10]
MEKKIINKKTLQHLAELARIDLEEKKEEKMVKDLEEILEYFNKLKEINTEKVEPITGGLELADVFRNDDEGIKCEALRENLIKSFPEEENGFLKIPAVFE